MRHALNTLDKNPWSKPYKIVMKKLSRGVNDLTIRLPEETTNKILNGLFPQAPAYIKEDDEEIIMQHPRVTIFELERILKLTAKRKPAPGPDGIIAPAMKVIMDQIPIRIADTFNSCLARGKFPDVWKTSRLILLKKTG